MKSKILTAAVIVAIVIALLLTAICVFKLATDDSFRDRFNAILGGEDYYEGKVRDYVIEEIAGYNYIISVERAVHDGKDGMIVYYVFLYDEYGFDILLVSYNTKDGEFRYIVLDD